MAICARGARMWWVDERAGMTRTHRSLGFAIALIVLLIDQASKYYAVRGLGLPDRESIELLPIFRFIWVENHGVSMSLFTARSELERWLLTLATAAIAVAVGAWLWREK